MIKCTFDISIENYTNRMHLETTYVDANPEKDEEGNWKPVLMIFKPDDNGPVWEIFSKLINFGPISNCPDPIYGSAILQVNDVHHHTYYDRWELDNIWPKSLKFDDNNDCEVIWQFKDATLIRK